jgi:hypothetical protein
MKLSRVKLGAKKSDRPCEVVRNGIYVFREGDTSIFQIKGRGGTGMCADDILTLR